MNFKITSFWKTEKNRPLALFLMLFNCYLELAEELDRIMERTSFLTEMKWLDENSLGKRERLMLASVRVANAIKALNLALGRPPTVAEVAEASGEPVERVARFLRGDHKHVGPEMLPFGVSLENCDRREFDVWRDKVRKNAKMIPKRPGRHAIGMAKVPGRPSKIVKLSERLLSLEKLWLELSESERDRLEAYLRSKPMVDVVREFHIKSLSLSWILLNRGELVKKGVENLLKYIGQNVMQIAERNTSSRLTPELRWYYSFDWMLQGLEAWRQCPEKLRNLKLDEIINHLKEMPDDEFASRFIIGPFKQSEKAELDEKN